MSQTKISMFLVSWPGDVFTIVIDGLSHSSKT